MDPTARSWFYCRTEWQPWRLPAVRNEVNPQDQASTGPVGVGIGGIRTPIWFEAYTLFQDFGSSGQSSFGKDAKSQAGRTVRTEIRGTCGQKALRRFRSRLKPGPSKVPKRIAQHPKLEV